MSKKKLRYSFGKNWINFVNKIQKENFFNSKKSLRSIIDKRKKISFIDVGCGSGLFSLAANEYYKKVVSIDVDPDSIKATKLLKKNLRLVQINGR